MFGMGTGGSLRLLSPEIWGCQGGTLSLRLHLRSGSASRYPGSFRFASLWICSSDSLCYARSSFAPSKPHRFAFASLRLTKALFRYSLRHSALLQIIFLVSGFVIKALLRSRASYPCSLLPDPSFQDQALDRLVSSSSIRYRTSTDDLSTLSSSRGLTHF